MPNIKNTIDGHNKEVLQNITPEAADNTNKTCNCRDKNSCPLDNNCLVKSIKYQATITTDSDTQTYVGLTENTFKTRYNNHKASLRNQGNNNATELSKYIKTLNDSKTTYSIKWSILDRAKAYSNNSRKCNLCIPEKLYIICKPKMATLNNRSELISKCRHSNKFLLSKA